MLTDLDFAYIAQLVKDEAGITLEKGKEYLVTSRVDPMAKSLGYADIAALVSHLKQSGDTVKRRQVVESLTTHETSFFRDYEPFEGLRKTVLPQIIEKQKDKRELTIWCGAASSGQEPYSLAIAILEAAAQRGQELKVEIYASDVSVRALERARTGVFSHFEVQKGLSARRLVDHFQRKDDAWQASPALRNMVRWRRVNLLAEGPGSARFDVVLCRGILPRTATQKRPALVLNLYNALAPDGVLAVGQGEGEGPADLAPALNVLPGMDGLFSRNPDFRVAA